jgi:long-chain acyl-CoA synthetase
VIVTAVTDYIKGFPVSSSKSLDLEEGWLHFSELLDKTTSTRRIKVDVAPEDPASSNSRGVRQASPRGLF